MDKKEERWLGKPATSKQPSFWEVGFPEETMIEDVHLGFYLVADRIPIVIIPIFEIGDTPERLIDGLTTHDFV